MDFSRLHHGSNVDYATVGLLTVSFLLHFHNSTTTMADIFRSAISYFSGGGGTSRGSDFLGQTVQLGDGLTFMVKKVIAEGMLKFYTIIPVSVLFVCLLFFLN